MAMTPSWASVTRLPVMPWRQTRRTADSVDDPILWYSPSMSSDDAPNSFVGLLDEPVDDLIALGLLR
jgi:hypothetical protein